MKSAIHLYRHIVFLREVTSDCFESLSDPESECKSTNLKKYTNDSP